MGWQYVVPGYLLVFVGLAVYAWSILQRVRAAARDLTPEERRFLD